MNRQGTFSQAPQEEDDAPERIAVVGMAGRFPGAPTLARFWSNLCEGKEGITFFEDDELRAAGIPQRTLDKPGYVKAAPILEDIAAFDAHFFGYTPREAEVLDPQQRIFLETVWEALENAGWDGETGKGAIGVFAGSSLSHYLMHHLSHMFTYSERGFESLIGNDKDYLASRVAYKLDLGGPSIAVQTACSTSLVAIHLACQSLLGFETDLAVAGGVTLRLPVRSGYVYQEGGLFSPDGHCRPFDAAARGTMFGSGAGVVVLKRLSAAREDGDRIRAVILGSAVNNDGARKVGYTAPGETGQVRVISEALGIAAVEPETIGYLETHGTGTALGDPIEAAALRRVFGGPKAKANTCMLGSVKSNVGHLECAAGVAGFIKTVLILEHGQIPPTLHFQKLNPHIEFQGTPFAINATLKDWPGNGPRRAGVSSFGIGGTNAHLILEQAPEPSMVGKPNRAAGPIGLAISARCDGSLHDLAAAYDYQLSGTDRLYDICASAGLRRAHHTHRLAVVGTDRRHISSLLEAYGRGETPPGLAVGQHDPGKPRKIVFVYPGQGSQWRGMGRNLYQNQPVFAQALKECAAPIQRYAGFSVLDVVHSRLDDRFDEVDVVQPCLFAMSYALTKLWISWGIEPQALIGHSQGEIAAAAVAGVLSVDEAARVVCFRSKLVRELEGRGAMAVAEVDLETARVLAGGLSEPVSVAAINGPRSIVFSGSTAGMEQLQAQLEERAIYHRRVNVTYASHCSQVEAVLGPLSERLSSLRPKAGNVPLYSTVTGQKTDGAGYDAAYWCQNLRQTVRFSEMVQLAEAEGHSIFVEVSPHPVLLHALRDTVVSDSRVCGSLRREENEEQCLLESLGILYCLGKQPRFATLFDQPHRYVALPSYPWQRQHYWIEPVASATQGGARLALAGADHHHALLAGYLASASQNPTWYWQVAVSAAEIPYLEDHQVQGQVIVPGSFHLELALAAAWQVTGADQVAIHEAVIAQPLFLADDLRVFLQIQLSKEGSERLAFRVTSCDPAQGIWTEHVHGTLHANATGSVELSPLEASREDLDRLRERCPQSVELGAFYAHQQERGLGYGPAFRALQELHVGPGRAMARLVVPAVLEDASDYRFHPALLDACFQVLLAAAPADEYRTFLPVGMHRLELRAQPRGEVWVFGELQQGGGASASGDLSVYDEDGILILSVKELQFRQVEDDFAEHLASLRFSVSWIHDPNQNSLVQPVGVGGDPWLLFADEGAVAADLAAALNHHGGQVLLVRRGTAYQVHDQEVLIDPQRPEHFATLLRGRALSGIVYLWGLDMEGLELEPVLRDGTDPLLALAQVLVSLGSQAPSLTVVTSGGRPIPPWAHPCLFAQAPLLALAAVIASEHPELRCRCIDLDPDTDADQSELLLRELLHPDAEDRVAWRAGIRRVARLVHQHQEHDPLLRFTENPTWRLETDQIGSLDGLHLRETQVPEPGPGELKLAIKAAGLNFRDVLTAMNRRGDQLQGDVPMGGECAGVVVAVGPGVIDYRVGDEVVALALPAFASFATVPVGFVQPKPERFSFAEAACHLITPLTAYVGLVELAHLQRGERVLIHSGAGGTGLIAIYLAQQIGAIVFATAGSPEKRNFLQSLGIAWVGDSRSTDFVAEIRKATHGEGVDVVLNSLSGDGLLASLDVLAPYGRFVELGISDIYANTRMGLYPFHKNLSYHSLNLARMMVDRPERVSRSLRIVLDQLNQGLLPGLPVRAFPFSQAADAFGLLARAGHIGKIALLAELDPPVKARRNVLQIKDRATYLITGGLGGLGLLFAEWLANTGARHLLLLSRRSPDDGADQRLAELRNMGVTVTVAVCDVSDRAAVARVLADLPEHLPLKGILHTAGVLDDGALETQTPARFRKTMAAKVDGALHLHHLTEQQELDFFVLFSSTASLFGTVGQANYAAANACLDALAWFRHEQGLPALSINWGGWAQVGMAASQLSGAAFRFGIQPAFGLGAVAQLLSQTPTAQIAITAAPFPPNLMGRSDKPKFYELIDQAKPSQGGDPGLKARLAASPSSERQLILETYLIQQVAQVLRVPTHEIQADTPLNTYGLTSLFALELRNRVEADVQLPIPVLQFFQDRDLQTFAKRLLERLALAVLLELPSASGPEEEDEDYDELTL